MPLLPINGINIHYEILGDRKKGMPMCYTPGGQSGIESSNSSGLIDSILTDQVCILLWDRRNSTGQTGVNFADEESLCKPELQMQCEDLHALLFALDLLPIVLMGNSTGSSLSVDFAMRYPKAVR
jgi:pimeloyl-ACP methyl ester carboxylesterase